MKRLAIILTVLVLIFSSPAPASAAGLASFSLESAECSVGKTVSVAMRAEGSEKLSAALFCFQYDRSLLEFCGASAAKGSRIEYNETADGIKVSFLCEFGAELSAVPALFHLKFKALSEGVSDLSYSVSDCVGGEPGHISIGSCVGATITAAGKTSRVSGGTKKKSDSAVKTKSKTSSAASSSSKSRKSSKSSAVSEAPQQESRGAEYNELGKITEMIQKDSNSMIPFLAVGLAAVVAIGLICVLVSRFINRKKEK